MGTTIAGTNLLDLVSVATVKARLGISSTDQDAQIASLISSVSARMAAVMLRSQNGVAFTKVARRTEQRAISPGRNMLSLRANPITTVHSVKWGETTDLASTNPLIEGTDYFVQKGPGVIRFLSSPPAWRVGGIQRAAHPSMVEIDYTGGLADTPENLIANGYGDIAEACAMQVAYLRQRLERGAIGASSSETGGSKLNYDGPYDLLPDVADVCARYTRRTF